MHNLLFYRPFFFVTVQIIQHNMDLCFCADSSFPVYFCIHEIITITSSHWLSDHMDLFLKIALIRNHKIIIEASTFNLSWALGYFWLRKQRYAARISRLIMEACLISGLWEARPASQPQASHDQAQRGQVVVFDSMHHYRQALASLSLICIWEPGPWPTNSKSPTTSWTLCLMLAWPTMSQEATMK